MMDVSCRVFAATTALLLALTATASAGTPSERDVPSATKTPADVSTSRVAAAFTATPLQGATCVAPCAVHFDSAGTDDPKYARDFHALIYRWDFGDAAAKAQSWWHTAQTRVTRNEDFGPIVGHVYEAPGTYTATLTATAPDGKVGTATRRVVVADPAVVFSNTTYCVSTSGTFTGCNGTHITSSDFDAALATAGVGGAKRRVLFRGGETFANSAVTRLFRSSAPGLIGSYGSGRAKVTTSANWIFQMHSGWQVTGLAIDCGTTECGLFTREVGARPTFTATPINNAGFYDVSITGPVAECASAFGAGSTVRNHDAWFIANTCEKTAKSTTGTQFLIGIGDRNLFIGNTLHVNNREVQQLILRVLFTNSVVSHNEANSPGADKAGGTSFRGILQLRADGTGPEPVPNTRNEVAYNKFAVRNGPMGVGADWAKICSHHSGCDQTTPEGAACADVIYENNLHTIDGTPGIGIGAGIVVQCADTTVRNNVFDLQGQGAQMSPGSGPILVQLKAKPANVANADRVEVYGNTAYVTGEGNDFTACDQSSNAGTGHRCAANLAYLPGHGGKRTATRGAGWTNTKPANDLRTAPIPSWWPGKPPLQGATDFLDFLAASGGCDITAASLAQAGAQHGCLVR